MLLRSEVRARKDFGCASAYYLAAKRIQDTIFICRVLVELRVRKCEQLNIIVIWAEEFVFRTNNLANDHQQQRVAVTQLRDL